MPFAVFRRHQRKLLAIFAILAMFGFVVADSLPRLLSGGYQAGGNPVVVDLYGSPVRRSDLNEMAAERNNANLFMAELTALVTRRPAQNFFGDLNTRSLVDALVLRHEADRLGMPAGPEVARTWLKQLAGASMTRELFELILSRFNNRVSGEQLLSQIADQVRLANVRLLRGNPVVTPLDVFSAYRDQNERVSARVVGFPAEDFLAKVPEPSAAEVQKFYDTYKDTTPDPDRPTPGFKIPREVQVEILSLDGEALARSIKDRLTESELLSYYENRKSEFKRPSQFPDEIFQGAPELTPPQVQTFAEVRPYLANSLAEEKAQAEILDTFGKIKDEVMIPFADKYLMVADEIAESKKLGTPVKSTPPRPEPLKPVAEKAKLDHEITPLLTRARAEHYGLVSGAEVGLNRFSGGRKFAEELFDTKSSLFEPIELTDAAGRRYLIRKLQDLPPRVPGLDEIRTDVTLAWKTAQARPLAKKAAEAFAEKVKAEGGKIKGEIVEGHPVITTDPVTRLQPGLPLPGQFFETGPPTPTEISQIAAAGPAFRDAYFGLTEGAVAVAPNRPETVYYVLTLDHRAPARFDVLYAPNGDYFRYRSEAMSEAFKKRDEDWMNVLRAQAGLDRDWTPRDEAKNASDSPPAE
jgi:peptidyl-prolyl cis-trans isomerase D